MSWKMIKCKVVHDHEKIRYDERGDIDCHLFYIDPKSNNFRPRWFLIDDYGVYGIKDLSDFISGVEILKIVFRISDVLKPWIERYYPELFLLYPNAFIKK